MYDKQNPSTIQSLFSQIAPRYDRANAVLSFGLFHRWNQRLIDTIHHQQPGKIHLLDLCAGTGAIALSYLQQHPQSITTLADFCQEMLDVAAEKMNKIGIIKSRYGCVCADATALPFEENQFDAITIAYGIRNVKDPTTCFKECLRVLKPGGTLALLDLTRPSNPLLRQGHKLYLQTCLPLIGALIAGNSKAYSYLSRSIGQFAAPIIWMDLLSKNKFSEIKKEELLGGIASIVSGKKSLASTQ